MAAIFPAGSSREPIASLQRALRRQLSLKNCHCHVRHIFLAFPLFSPTVRARGGPLQPLSFLHTSSRPFLQFSIYSFFVPLLNLRISAPLIFSCVSQRIFSLSLFSSLLLFDLHGPLMLSHSLLLRSFRISYFLCSAKRTPCSSRDPNQPLQRARTMWTQSAHVGCSAFVYIYIELSPIYGGI